MVKSKTRNIKKGIINLYKGGLSSIKIAKKFSVSKRTILRVLKGENIIRRKNKDYRKIDYSIVKSLYSMGLSRIEISKNIGFSQSGVYKVLRNIGADTKRDSHKSPPNKLNLPEKEIVGLYVLYGFPSNKIAKIYHIKHGAICNRLRNMGIKLNDPKESLKKHNEKIRRVGKSQYNKIVELYNRGYSSTQISRMYQCSDGIICKILHNNNVKLRDSVFGYRKGLYTDRGDKVLSSGELIISNWLYSHNLDYVYDKLLPNSNFRCDFYLPQLNIYIEYFGLNGVSFYDEVMYKKIKFYKDNNLKSIQIFPSDNIKCILDTSLLNNKLDGYISSNYLATTIK